LGFKPTLVVSPQIYFGGPAAIPSFNPKPAFSRLLVKDSTKESHIHITAAAPNSFHLLSP
jgi:hypothetical protein